MSLFLSTMLVLLVGGWQDDEAAKKVAEEDKKFQGTWEITEMEVRGEKSAIANASFSVKGKKYEQWEGDNLVEAGTQDLDPSKDPKHMDVTVTEGETKGKKQLAIYKIEDDVITMCFADHGSKERPTKFSTSEGGGFIMIKMKKKK